MAEQIIAIALDHGVKLREDADLAGVLAALDIDSPIPLGALSTVTGILSYVHRARGAPDNCARGAPDDSAMDNSEDAP
ncbi:MAG: hypothetical protein IIA00_00285 [Proteobacteria bacterium]|nr:hypothetical protein [Pseudomonadota bacterium]